MTDGLRPTIVKAQRVVVKVGSSSLTDAEGHIDDAHLTALVDAIAAAKAAGKDVVLVSSGAIAAGLAPLRLKRRPRDLASQQAAASVGQGLLVEKYAALFARHGITVGQVLLTADDISRKGHYDNALRTFSRLLALGVVPIVNENDTVATGEIRFGDNDRLAALVAQLVGADALILLSDVDALYTDHPDAPGAERITDVLDVEDLAIDTSRRGSDIGSGGMTTKLEAARIATHAGMRVVLTNADAVGPALRGERVGTYFHRTGRKRARRLLWLAYASHPRGELHLDAGAVTAVVERNASLLPAGVTGATGAFHAGDPVALVGPDGAVVARGLVNYDHEDLPGMMGRSTRDLVAERGPAFDRELVHRDAMIVKPRAHGH